MSMWVLLISQYALILLIWSTLPNIALATLPLSALPSEDVVTGIDTEVINITEWHPRDVQWHADTSLNSTQHAFDGHPTLLHWWESYIMFSAPVIFIYFKIFKNPNATIFPESMKLLVIVMRLHPAWFCFWLKLNYSLLHVNIHGQYQLIKDGLKHIVFKPWGHEGWCFKINGVYHPKHAYKAFQDATSQQVPNLVGLKATVQQWKNLSTSAIPAPVSKYIFSFYWFCYYLWNSQLSSSSVLHTHDAQGKSRINNYNITNNYILQWSM